LQLFARQKKPSFTHARLLYRLSYQKSRGKFVKIACSRGFLRIFPIAALLYKSVFSSYYILIQLFSDIFFRQNVYTKESCFAGFQTSPAAAGRFSDTKTKPAVCGNDFSDIL